MNMDLEWVGQAWQGVSGYLLDTIARRFGSIDLSLVWNRISETGFVVVGCIDSLLFVGCIWIGTSFFGAEALESGKQ